VGCASRRGARAPHRRHGGRRSRSGHSRREGRPLSARSSSAVAACRPGRWAAVVAGSPQAAVGRILPTPRFGYEPRVPSPAARSPSSVLTARRSAGGQHGRSHGPRRSRPPGASCPAPRVRARLHAFDLPPLITAEGRTDRPDRGAKPTDGRRPLGLSPRPPLRGRGGRDIPWVGGPRFQQEDSRGDEGAEEQQERDLEPPGGAG
jgi:hypothetical protein